MPWGYPSFFSIKIMNTDIIEVNAAETVNAASMSEEFAKNLNEMVYRGYCAGTFRDHLGNDITIVFRCDFLELKVVPFCGAIIGESHCEMETYCYYYKDCYYCNDSIEVSLFKNEELKEIVEEYIPFRAEAMNYDEDEEEQMNPFGYPYYYTIEGNKHIFHLENDYGDCAVIEKR